MLLEMWDDVDGVSQVSCEAENQGFVGDRHFSGAARMVPTAA